jgi:glycosyltransferase involved in cell wall biosynthesis
LADGENALLFDEDDAAGLADRLGELRRSPDRSRQLARAARARVDSAFTHECYVDRIEGLLTESVSKARAGATR